MVDHQNHIIIFCQAPRDVQYVLSLYEKYRTDQRISIYVINLEGIYNYFQSLNLNLQDLIFIPYPKNVPLKDMIKLNKIRTQLKSDYNEYFHDMQKQTVYFFTKYFDWLTAYYISRISKKNRVYIIDHSGEIISGLERISGILITYRQLVYRYLTSINFRFLRMQSTLIMEFPVENYLIEKESLEFDPSVFKKYRVSTNTNKAKAVLLFESNQTGYDFYKDYKHEMTAIVEIFIKSGYEIYLKPHPRQGYSDFLKPFIESILPAEIPGEFFNPDDFTIIAAVDTNTISFFAKEYRSKTISLLELFTFKKDEEKERFQQTQLKLSAGKILFVPSISELKKMIG